MNSLLTGLGLAGLAAIVHKWTNVSPVFKWWKSPGSLLDNRYDLDEETRIKVENSIRKSIRDVQGGDGKNCLCYGECNRLGEFESIVMSGVDLGRVLGIRYPNWEPPTNRLSADLSYVLALELMSEAKKCDFAHTSWEDAEKKLAKREREIHRSGIL